MCGIAGILTYRQTDAPVNRDELLKIRDAMAMRGPDGAGFWIADNGCVGLAHRRLAIIDLGDSGAQPMASRDGKFRIVFNGEIYNYKHLRIGLEKRGYRFQSQSDTEVLLYLYAEHGVEMVRSLRGMYAFAVWDENKKGLLLARDPFGIKPLYYADDGHNFRFASQVKALLRSQHINTAPDPAGHVGFFLWGSVPEPYTLYKGIRALPAGATLWVDAHGTRQPAPFISIREVFTNALKSNPPAPRGAWREELRTALLDSVRHHLIADVPVGLFLSSGIDSATLTALASEVHSSPLHTVTLGFREYEGSAQDETLLAETVAKRYGCIHQTRWISKEEFGREYERLLKAMDQPTIDGVNTYFVSKAAAESGMKVAISGLGGDELFGGYPSFRDVPRMVKYLSPFRVMPRVGRAFRLISAPLLKHLTSPKYAGLLEYGGTYGGAYLLRRGLFMPWELPDLIDPDMAREGWQELQPLARLEETISGIKGGRKIVSALEMTWYMRNQLLRDADWAGMAHSLEIRVPLIDVELFRVLAAVNVAPDKRDMVDVLSNPLPHELIVRQKTGFSVPMVQWLSHKSAVTDRGLRGWARQLMIDSSLLRQAA